MPFVEAALEPFLGRSQGGLVALLFAAFFLPLSAGCASAGLGDRPPLLTNPPRHAAWADAPTSEEPSKYEGIFRLPLSEDWSWELPDTGHWTLNRLELGGATIAGDTVLVGSSRSPGLEILDRTTGRSLQSVAMPGPVQAHPIQVGDDWIVADTFGNVQRFDASWTPVWETPYGAGAAIYRAPILVGDLLVFSTGADTVLGVHVETGVSEWSFTREVARGSLELAILGSPSAVVAGDHVVVGFSDGSISGLDPKIGVERWREQVGGGKFPDVQAEALVVGDLLVAGAFGGPLVALDIATRTRRWENPTAGATSAMTLAGGMIYTTDVQGRLVCIDATNGQEVWKWEYKDAQLGTPVRAGGSILVGDVGGTVHAVDRFEGTLQWSYQPTDGTRLAGVAAAVTIDGRQVLFTTSGGSIRSLIAAELSGGAQPEQPSQRPDRSLGW
jgi:outer membrane protein assembly factor BamB